MKKISKYRKNLFFLTAHFVFAKRITGPIMMLLYQAFGLNYSQIGTLSAITTLSDASLEVYGGAFSDVYGRRQCSILYSILAMANMAIFAFGHSFVHFAIGNAVYGASLAIGSGNASTLLFDTLSVLKATDKYKKHRGMMQFAAKVMNGLIILCLPFLYMRNIKLPFYIGLGLYFIAFITALFLKEPPKLRRKAGQGIIKTVLNSFKEITSNRKVGGIIAFQAIWAGFILLFFEYFQPIIKAANIPLIYFGFVYALARLFEGLGGGLIHKFEHHSNQRLLYINILMLVIALLGFAFTRSYILLAFILIGCAADGVADVLQSELLNNNVTSKNRTTIMSSANVLGCLFTSLVLYVFGHVSDRVGVQEMFGWAGLSFLLFLTALFLALRNSMLEEKGKKQNSALKLVGTK